MSSLVTASSAVLSVRYCRLMFIAVIAKVRVDATPPLVTTTLARLLSTQDWCREWGILSRRSSRKIDGRKGLLKEASGSFYSMAVVIVIIVIVVAGMGIGRLGVVLVKVEGLRGSQGGRDGRVAGGVFCEGVGF